MSPEVSCRELVGRDEELARLAIALESIGQSSGVTVLVSGEAGIGKTRLVSELCMRASELGYGTAIGACSPIDGKGLPYGPVVAVLRALDRQLGPEESARLLGPALRAVGLREPQQEDGDRASSAKPVAGPLAKTWLFEVILDCLVAVARVAPNLLVFEDLHWADTGTLGLLDHLSRGLVGLPTMMVISYRNDELSHDHPLRRFIAELGRCSQVTRLELVGLQGDDLVNLVSSILGGRPRRSLIEAVSTRSGGNPFFVEELLAAGAPSEVPSPLQDVILARLEEFSADAKTVLTAASAVGSFHLAHELLDELTELTYDGLLGALSELIDRSVLIVDHAGTGYQFRHELLRQCVYDSLLPGERKRLHHRIAMAMDDDRRLLSAGPEYGEIEMARHWWSAGQWDRALDASVVAADAAMAVYAFEEVLIHVDHARACVDRLGPGADQHGVDRVHLLELASDAAYLAALGREAVDRARAAVEALDPSSERLRTGDAYVRLARAEWAVSDQERAFQALEAAKALIPVDPPTLELARALAENAKILMLVARIGEAERICHEAIRVARAVGACREEGHALNTLGVCRGCMGHYGEGIDLVRSAVQIAEELGSPEDLNRAYANVTSLLSQAGRLDEVADFARRTAAGDVTFDGVRLEAAMMNGADALFDLGHWSEAEEIFLSVDKAMGNCANHPALSLAAVAIREGRFSEAAEALAVTDERTQNLADVQFRGLLYVRQAELAIEEARYEDAYEAIERALSLASGSDDELLGPEMCALGARALAERLAAARKVGFGVEEVKLRLLAAELTDRAMSLVARPSERGGTCAPRAAAFAAQCEAETSRLGGANPQLWESAATRWVQLHQPFETAYCQWRQAEALMALRSRRAFAGQLLQTAWSTTVELGAVPLRARIEDLAQRARVPLEAETEEAHRRAELESDLGLTSREVEVLGYLASGKTDGQIAEALFISKKTASVHVSNLLRKLDAENRYAAAEIGRGLELSAEAKT